jgi:large-conductance mechanosensitive channel
MEKYSLSEIVMFLLVTGIILTLVLWLTKLLISWCYEIPERNEYMKKQIALLQEINDKLGGNETYLDKLKKQTD